MKTIPSIQHIPMKTTNIQTTPDTGTGAAAPAHTLPQWGAFSADGRLRALLESESEAYYFVKNRGHMYGGTFRKMEATTRLAKWQERAESGTSGDMVHAMLADWQQDIACAGMQDPAAEIAELRTALTSLLAVHDSYPAIEGLPEMPWWTQARRALAGGKGAK